MEDVPLVLAPVSQLPPFPQLEDLKGDARVKRMLDEQSMLYAVNLLGLPAADWVDPLSDANYCAPLNVVPCTRRALGCQPSKLHSSTRPSSAWTRLRLKG